MSRIYILKTKEYVYFAREQYDVEKKADECIAQFRTYLERRYKIVGIVRCTWQHYVDKKKLKVVVRAIVVGDRESGYNAA